MGDPYTDVTVENFNQNPPPDDGSATDANEIRWATHLNKLANPLKTAIEALDTNVGAAVDRLVGGAGVFTVSSTQTLGASVQGQLVRITAAAITVTTPDATSVGAPFVFAVLNNAAGNVTLAGNGSQTIDGSGSVNLLLGSGVWVFTDGSNWFTAGQNFSAPYPRGHIGGLRISNNGGDAEHDIDIAVGSARDAADSINLDILTTLTKRIDENWQAGTNMGGRATGASLDVDTWFHVFLVDDGSGNTDAGFDTSLTASNLLSDTGGSFYRRIGSVLTDGSSNIIAFDQEGDEFLWLDPPLDIDDSSAGTTAELGTLSTPLGIKTIARINAIRFPGDLGDDRVYISSPDANNEAPSTSSGPLSTALSEEFDNEVNPPEYAFTMTVRTNTSSQIRYRANDSDDLRIATLGWFDSRGRND